MHRQAARARYWYVWTTVAVLVSGASAYLGAQKKPAKPVATPAAVAPSALVADVTIRQTTVDKAGRLLRTPPPAVSMHVESNQSPAGWKTKMTMTQDGAVVRSGKVQKHLDNPFQIARVEYDGDGTPPRLFNAAGQRVNPPVPADRALLKMPMSGVDWNGMRSRFAMSPLSVRTSDWIDGIIAMPDKRPVRLAAIQARFRKVETRPGGVDRYVRNDGDLGEEMLVNATESLPVEVNVAQNGALMVRTMLGYVSRRDGGLIRKLMHHERAIPEVSGARALTDIELTNVVTSTGGAK